MIRTIGIDRKHVTIKFKDMVEEMRFKTYTQLIFSFIGAYDAMETAKAIYFP